MQLLGTGYSLDLRNRLLQFTVCPDSGSQWIIHYQFRPFTIRRAYTYARIDTVQQDSITGVARLNSEVPARPSAAAMWREDLLEKSGSVFRGVSLGTGGMRLQSGLRLQLNGQLAPGVEITAALTDQSTPIQPEGNTQSLQEIDKVFVQLRMHQLKATLGDLVFEARDFGMGSYSRKLQGVQAEAGWERGRVTLMAAAGKGQFKSQHLTGLEGVQGPYQLTGAQGQREIIVLAGTERVYLDGREMTRGEENDYTIDYANGQVLFTRKQLITGDSRITVDFEFSDQKFQKSIVGATGQAAWLNNRIRMKTALLREEDKDNPLDMTLTEAQRSILSSVGDSLQQASMSGAQHVGEGAGSYVKELSNGEVIYTYVGAGLGDTVVRFSYVGPGKGDYLFKGYGIYLYKGPQQGDYLPIFFLPVAQRQQLATMQVEASLTSKLSVQGEAGFSQQDLNLYSNLNDADNSDRALSANLQLKPVPLGPGQISGYGRWRDVGERFRFAGRAVEVEHGRRWGMAEGETSGERSWETGGRYALSSKSAIAFEKGALHRINGMNSKRQLAEIILQSKGLPSLSGRDERVQTSLNGLGGLWQQREGRIQGRLSMFDMQAVYRSEHRKDEDLDSLWTGRKFEDLSSRIAFRRKRFNALLVIQQRHYQRYESGRLKPHSVANTQNVNIDWKNTQGFNVKLLFTRRRRAYEDAAVAVQSSDLAESRIQFIPRSRKIECRINYRYASNKASEMVRDTIEVGRGLGNYRYDEGLNELVPDSDGDLLIRQIQTGQFLPVNHLQLNGDLRVLGGKWVKTGVVSALNLRSTWRIERRDKERDFALVNQRAFAPQWQSDSTLVSGQLQQQHDFEYRPARGKVHLRLRFRNNQSETHQLLNEGQHRAQRLWALRVRSVSSKTWSFESTLHLRGDDRDYERVLRSDRRIREQGAMLKLNRRLHRKMEAGVDLSYAHATDRAQQPETDASSFFITPRLRWTLGRKGQLRAEWAFGRIHARQKNRALPYEMFDGDQPGTTHRWAVYLNYRLNQFVQATLSYRGRNEPWRTQIYQTGQIEVRAFF